MLSAIIITHNEARNIGRCLNSLSGVVDEIIVVDSFSTDETEQICRAHPGVRFYQRTWSGYIDQKNWAADQAAYDLVFSIDADEAPDERLRASLQTVRESSAFEAWEMNRLTNYCGQWIRHSGWYPDRKIRVYDRRKVRWAGEAVHEILDLDPGVRIGRLEGDLLHYSYYTVEEHYARARKYAALAAEAMRKKGKRGAWWRRLLSPPVKFLRNYVFRLGFLDGRAGLTICRIAALETWWKYSALLKRD